MVDWHNCLSTHLSALIDTRIPLVSVASLQICKLRYAKKLYLKYVSINPQLSMLGINF